MLRLTCPFCGERDFTEFRYGGDATKVRPGNGETSAEAWHEHVFLFRNPKGAHVEHWQHVLGCRQWIVVERDTATHEVGSTHLARDHEGKP
jgi:sarcosine oxidase subunit delta